MNLENKIPGQEDQNQSIKDSAIDKKGNTADGQEINYQNKQRQEIHQPRDNA
ncbi:hypothetical protein NBT05_18280 [Aquimarina sp. ERC-38]|uniref:hypothetical protein n=1 Tax=Aquimarina sp. ERC-38 TaxID=2949996 RepID=UPI0022469F3F|nr:hypothetical protein [Aquimarina sp. ERC-38]UZO80873.1 hypothetical protein NBT05_18280 [Aquimarina sp. ERC-38]